MNTLPTRRLGACMTLMLACALCATASAKGAQTAGTAADVHYAWANVTRVNPIYRTVTVSDPQTSCAPAAATPSSDGKTSSAGTHAGPNQSALVGKKSAAACPQAASTDTSKERRIVGYNVEYRYRGHLYMARLKYDPGERLRVRVSVTPAH